MNEPKIPNDLTDDERKASWGVLCELYGEVPIPEREAWKIAAMYLRANERIAALEQALGDHATAIAAKDAEIDRLRKDLADAHTMQNGQMRDCLAYARQVTEQEEEIASLKAQLETSSGVNEVLMRERNFDPGAANVLSGFIAERDRLKAQLAALEWKPILPDCLPQDGDTVVGFRVYPWTIGIVSYCSIKDFDVWRERDITHFRSTNPPEPPEPAKR